MSAKSKGDRAEREARNTIEEAGWEVESPNYTRYQNTDFFNLFDFMAMKKGEKPKFVQVKSNGARGIREAQEEASDWIPLEHIDVEWWVRHDKEGWRVLKVGEDSYETLVDARENGDNITETLKRYLHGEY